MEVYLIQSKNGIIINVGLGVKTFRVFVKICGMLVHMIASVI